MITILNDAPENVAAFNATGEIKREDFENLVIPHVKNKVDQFNELNYLLYLDTDIDHPDVQSWLTNSLSDLNSIPQYNRAAIVSDHEKVQKMTNTSGFQNFKFFWCNNGNEPER